MTVRHAGAASSAVKPYAYFIPAAILRTAIWEGAVIASCISRNSGSSSAMWAD
jgi:hypothetical protein